jgi:hypothetical protein
MSIFPGKQGADLLLRSANYTARDSRAGISRGVRFQIVFFLMNYDRFADD